MVVRVVVMCVIVDANVRDEFINESTPAARELRKWVERGSGRIVVGGHTMREELLGATGARRGRLSSETWKVWERLARAGCALDFSHRDEEVGRLAETLRRTGVCRSDDWHIIALAQMSGARLLFSNDRNLHADFRDATLVNKPRGKVYRSRNEGVPVEFDEGHRGMLQDRSLCKAA